MVGLLFALIVILWGWNGLYRGKKYKFVITMFLLLTEGLSMRIFEMNIKFTDLFLLLISIPLLHGIKKKGFFDISHDNIGKIILLLEFFFFLSFIITVITDTEDFGYAFKSYRNLWYFFAYFLLRRIPYDEYKKAFGCIFKISILWGIMFLTQIFNINLLKGGKEFNISMGSIERMRNIPIDTVLMVVSTALINLSVRYRTILFIFWGLIMVLSQHRGMMLSICIALPLMMFIRGKMEKIIQIALGAGLIIILFSSLLMERFSSKDNDSGMSMTEEIKKGLDFGSVQYGDWDGGSTFLFRSFLISERVEYMWKHPMNFIFGCGMLHEDSPTVAKKFHFQTGTYKLTESGNMILQQISTSDVAFLSWFIRYGLIVLLLISLLYICLFKTYYKNDNISGNIGMVLLAYCLVRFMSGDEFTAFMYMTFFICAICAKQLKSTNI